MIRVLAATHDPGGANAVAATAAALRAKGVHVAAIAKGPAQAQFRRLGVAFSPYVPEAVAGALREGVDLVLTGTSAIDGFERDAIVAARNSGVPSLAVVDYWLHHRQRFGAAGDGWILPDHVIAIDDRCRRQMIAEGLPEARIHPLGQPYFSTLLARAGKSTVRSPVQRLLFASEPGLRAAAALDLLLDALRSRSYAIDLTVRFHPRETERAQRVAQIDAAGCRYTVDESADPLETARQVDGVIGVTSMILIETSLLGVPTGSVGGDVDALVDYRLCVPLSTAADFAAFLECPRPSSPDPVFVAHQRGAAERVAEFCAAVAHNSRTAAFNGLAR